ncbi:MAG: nitroreductase family protein [Candidatus Woesearchaeota archaeon]
MDVLEAIFTRRSVRKFSDTAVEMEKIGIILDAGRYAPSAGNLQAWKFILVTDAEKRKQIAEASLQQSWMAVAPVHIVVCSEPEKAEQFYGIRGERLYSVQGCAACVQNMLLACHAEGLASCWVGAFEEEALKRILGLPDSIRPQAVLPIGYSAEHPRHATRQPLYDKVSVESYGSHVKDIQHVFGYHSARLQRYLQSTKAFATGEDKRLSRAWEKSKSLFSRRKN